MRLKDKVVVVTGSSRGIGRSIAEACAREGAAVVICSRREEAVTKTCRDFEASGYRVSGVKADVSVPTDLEKLLDHAVARWGRVDVWVNNAGISGGFRPFTELDSERIAAVVNINLTATINACRLIIPYFVRQGGGVLLNMSGRGGRGDPAPFMAVYAATKAGVTSLTRSLAREYKSYPISIHALLPGMVDTDLIRQAESSPEMERSLESLPYILNAVGTPAEVVGEFAAGIAAQKPGAITGKVYSLFKGWRLVRAVGLLTYYRVTGKFGNPNF